MMNNFVFLAHDPGGYEAIFPVAKQLSANKEVTVRVLLAGKASEAMPLFRCNEEEIEKIILDKISNNEHFILVTGTSWNSLVELKCIRLCKKNNIKTIAILDYWSSYCDRFKYENEMVYPDWIFVMDQLAYDEATAAGINPSIMKITGNPGLDYYVQRNNRNRNVLFFSQPLSMLYKIDDIGYDEFISFELFLNACKELGLYPHIKFHPKETPDMIERFGQYSVDGPIEEIARDYSAVVGMTTMGLLQCSLMGLPVISFQPNLKTHDLCIINKLGITKGAFSYAELVDQLKIITGAINEIHLPFWYDGKSTDRVVKALLEIEN